MSYAVDVSELPTWSQVDLESSGYVAGVGVGPCSFKWEGFTYELTRGIDSDPLPDFRGLVPRGPDGRYIRLPNPHWYYWDEARGRWIEHAWPPMAKTTAEVVPIREGLEIVDSDGEDSLSFAEMMDEALVRMGGVSFIVGVAQDNPLEFLKLRARMVSVDLKGMGAGDVAVTVNTIQGDVGVYKDESAE